MLPSGWRSDKRRLAWERWRRCSSDSTPTRLSDSPPKMRCWSMPGLRSIVPGTWSMTGSAPAPTPPAPWCQSRRNRHLPCPRPTTCSHPSTGHGPAPTSSTHTSLESGTSSNMSRFTSTRRSPVTTSTAHWRRNWKGSRLSGATPRYTPTPRDGASTRNGSPTRWVFTHPTPTGWE